MDYLDPFAAEHSSNEVLSLPSRARIRKRIRSKTPGKLMLRGRTSLIDVPRWIAVWLPPGPEALARRPQLLEGAAGRSPDALIAR
jgi:hypothetical protein